MHYGGLLPQQFHVAEGRQFSWDIIESDLVRWWLHQSEKMERLQTTEGQRLILLDKGKRNDGPGPDIYHARIIFDDLELSGSVEMHTRARDWYTHGHQNDERYRDVILHVISGGTGGPDIPTLVVDQKRMGATNCIAHRPVGQEELIHHALDRFKDKEQHIESLKQGDHGFDPLYLGMLEIIAGGIARHQTLQQMASMLGMKTWPDTRPWQGSNFSFPNRHPLAKQPHMIEQLERLTRAEHWVSKVHTTWTAWDAEFSELHKIGISINHCREWVVNILAPCIGGRKGFGLWELMHVFRHYGLEKHMLQSMGLSEVQTIAQQQGMLSWKNMYCRSNTCYECPLAQSHHTLTQLN